ncbi:MAG TPA: Hpt domain-containing protein, partial [Lysobacter sp.]|nr:Hpt domain-containing protein [Lysobacter sp.]
MTALRDAIDTTTLGWIKPEIDETLRQARGEIEAFAENPADTTLMRACASFLHQVHGTLRMVELYAPAMVAEEMERLAHALVVPQGAKGAVADRDEACGALMRGVVLLPDYLERLQGGHKDIPIVLLPLLNELRAARGETGLSESVLFVPNLDRPLPDSLPAPMPLPRQSRQLMAAQQLTALREALATWPEDGAPANIVGIAKAVDGLLESADHEATRRMLWVASSVATALRDGALPPTRALRQAFSGVEREARHIFEGEAAASVRVDPGTEPTRQLLYHVAHNEQAHGALDALRDTFDLAAQLPTESELAHARGSLSGRNRALLDTVAAAIKEDLLRVKDALDLHLRTKQTGVADLHPQVEALGRTADTLGMMGLGVARNVVLQQRDAMHDIVSGARPADEGALLDIAGALLYVDASLDDQVDRLGRPSEGEEADTIASESRKVLDVLVREAIANFADARQAFVAFVETSWDHAQLTDVPRLLEEVAGALRILELPQPAQYLAGVRRFTENELLGRRRVPNGQQLDTLADALASIEYYLEALRDQRPNRDNILDIARQSLESLRYWPLPDETAKPSVLADATLSEPVVDASQFDAPAADARTEARTEAPAAAPVVSAPTAPVAPAPAAAPVATGARGGFEATGDEIDDEIREVFLEEFEEEIGHLEQMLPGWRATPEDMEKLRPIRRVFHTLKGSGRLVGARTLGEFSWKVENMLNRVLDGTRP